MRSRTAMVAVAVAVGLAVAGCGDSDDSDDGATATTAAAEPTTSGAGATTTAAASEPMTGPATIAADDQTGDGTSVVVASVTLPTDGFVVVHAEADGAPGPILGWSELLPVGESTDVTVTLNTAIAESATVWPMAHVDANGNGEYEFMPPDVTIDVPATTAEGDVAVLPIAYTVG